MYHMLIVQAKTNKNLLHKYCGAGFLLLLFVCLLLLCFFFGVFFWGGGGGGVVLVKLDEQGWRFAKTWAQLLIRNFPLPYNQKL